MKNTRKSKTNLEDTGTWIKFSQKLCRNCIGSCCNLAVEVQGSDLIRMGLTTDFEYNENPKNIAKKLQKKAVIEHYHAKTETFTLSRMANGDCIFLNQKSRRCTIYDKRPDTCRNHPRIGPRPGYCAFLERSYQTAI